jgi:hypothetical protein
MGLIEGVFGVSGAVGVLEFIICVSNLSAFKILTLYGSYMTVIFPIAVDFETFGFGEYVRLC